jgi:hypothetical protein
MKKRVSIRSAVDAARLNLLITNILVKIKPVKMDFTAFVRLVEIPRPKSRNSRLLFS